MSNHTHADITPDCNCETSYPVREIANNADASETLDRIASHIHGLLYSLDEDMAEDRPELFAQFNALFTYLDKR